MRILGIETSCDETAAAVVEDGRVLSNVIASQAEIHGKFFGVVPELASRAHQQKIAGVIEEALALSCQGARLSDLRDVVDAVAYTQGPGLAGALLVGKVAAETLAGMHGLPLIGVNHLEGHAFAIEFVRKVRFPFISLIVSGGHTDLLLVRGYGDYRVLGRTRDDAAGEAFDKVAKILALSYPGGPVIDKLAKSGNRSAVDFPRPLLPGTWDFSFSGLKTAVLYHVQKHPRGNREDLCASFQEAVVETLAEKAMAAALRFKAPRIVLGGGVAANSRLRAVLTRLGSDRDVEVFIPPPSLCTDNGAMIAHVAELMLAPGSRITHRDGASGKQTAPRRRSLRIDPSLPVRSWSR